MPVENITVYYLDIVDGAKIITAVDGALTEVFWNQPWHWTIGAFVTMILIYMKTEDLFVTSLPGLTIALVLILYGKLTPASMLPIAFIIVLAFAAFFYGILKSEGT